jgi:predicted transcriptional regulator
LELGEIREGAPETLLSLFTLAQADEMKLDQLAVMTSVMCKGMTLREFFEEVARCNVPGLPYVDEQNRIAGRISVREVYRQIAVPDSYIRVANAMGDQTDRLDLSERKILKAFALPVESYLLENIPTVSPYSSIVKALTLMEAHNTHYIFLIEDGEYRGVVTRMVIANRMLECLKEMELSRHHSPDGDDEK